MKEKERRKTKSEENERRRREKAAVALLVFIIATMEIFGRKILFWQNTLLAVTLSQISPDMQHGPSPEGVLILIYLRVINETDPT